MHILWVRWPQFAIYCSPVHARGCAGERVFASDPTHMLPVILKFPQCEDLHMILALTLTPVNSSNPVAYNPNPVIP